MRINYTVKLLTPGMTASLGVIGKDIDATVKRDKDNRPYFNAKHIKGIVRERIRQFKLGFENNPEVSFVCVCVCVRLCVSVCPPAYTSLGTKEA